MNTVVFAHPRDSLPEKSLLPGKVELFEKLEERDIRPVLSFNAEAAFYSTSVEAYDLTGETTFKKAGSVALADVGLIVNRLDRSVKKSHMPDSWVSSSTPIMNENELRSLVYRKHRVQDELLEPLGLGIPSILVEDLVDASVFMEQHPSREYIIKPTSGTFSKGVMRLSPQEVLSVLSQDETKQGVTLLQPAYDFTHAFPSSFKPYDNEAAENFTLWANSQATKELRMYGFYTPDHTDVFPVARAMKDQTDHWLFVDPTSIPEKLVADTRAVLSRAAQLTASKAIYGALDIAYGTTSSDAEPDYHVVELNGRMPYLVGYDKHPGVADTLRTLKADQIQRVMNHREGAQ